MHFLVIDDDELSRELLAMLLENEGHEARLASSGEEGLARLSGNASGREFAPDVILADMQMSGVAGSELAVMLRSALREKTGKETKLIAMSGSQPPAAKLIGYDGFLLKPFTMEELTALLNRRAPYEVMEQADASQDDSLHSEAILPALNETIYGQLAKSMTAIQLGEIYALCLSDARTRIARMAKLVETGDDANYRREAHTVKGGCGLIGATELYRLAETAETSGIYLERGIVPNKGTSRIDILLSQFSGACDRLERILGERT